MGTPAETAHARVVEILEEAKEANRDWARVKPPRIFAEACRRSEACLAKRCGRWVPTVPKDGAGAGAAPKRQLERLRRRRSNPAARQLNLDFDQAYSEKHHVEKPSKRTVEAAEAVICTNAMSEDPRVLEFQSHFAHSDVCPILESRQSPELQLRRKQMLGGDLGTKGMGMGA